MIDDDDRLQGSISSGPILRAREGGTTLHDGLGIIDANTVKGVQDTVARASRYKHYRCDCDYG